MEFSYLVSPICVACKHFGVDTDPDAEAPDDVTPMDAIPMSASCAAFPKGIPSEIFVSSGDHYEPIGGEVVVGGKPIVFELEPGEEYALRNRETMKQMCREVDEELRALGYAPPNEQAHEAAHEVQKFNPYHDEIGRFTEAGDNSTGAPGGYPGGRPVSGKKKKKPVSGKKKKPVSGKKKKSGAGTKDDPIVTSDVKNAVRHLAAGRFVQLESVEQVSTMLTELQKITRDAEKKGKKAPSYDLCKVSVAGTNVFCAQHKDIPRIKMPQLAGEPRKGSKADKMPRNKWGEVDAADTYVKDLKERGISVKAERVVAANLKASQSQLVGTKIAVMLTDARAGKFDPTDRQILVSRDNYVIDGHHRWATVVGLDASDSKLGDIKMSVIRIDLPILEVLRDANDFANKIGIPPKVAKGFWGRVLKFNPYHDAQGRFTSAGGAVGGLPTGPKKGQPYKGNRHKPSPGVTGEPNPVTGKIMSNVEFGDTMETLFRMRAGRQTGFKRIFGGGLRALVGQRLKTRTGALDYRTDTHGLEIKSINIRSRDRRIKIDRGAAEKKRQAVRSLGLDGGIVAQIVDFDRGVVRLYGWEQGFRNPSEKANPTSRNIQFSPESRFVPLGQYKFTRKQWHEAQTRTIRLAVSGEATGSWGDYDPPDTMSKLDELAWRSELRKVRDDNTGPARPPIVEMLMKDRQAPLTADGETINPGDTVIELVEHNGQLVPHIYEASETSG